MNPQTIMVVAGESSGDAHAAALVRALKARLPQARFIGAGGAEMERAGVQNAFDLTADAVIGVPIKKLPRFFKRYRQLVRLAEQEKPELVVLVDFNFFNGLLAQAIRKKGQWRPKIVKYVSPQVWASRPGRAQKMARDLDLLLCLFPFEKEWYGQRVPQMRVECVGHPMLDKYPAGPREEKAQPTPTVLLLPGSRRSELRRHLPTMLAAAHLIESRGHVTFKMVVPTERLARQARSFQVAGMPKIEIQTGRLEQHLAEATVAISKTGTITMECAYFGVPTVTLYKTSWLTYVIGRRIVTVKYASMPNILADEELYPEFIQGRATAENIAAAALELLASRERRDALRAKLGAVVATLGGPGTNERAAGAIMRLLNQ